MPSKNISLKALFLQHVGQTSEMPMALEIDHAKGSWLYGPDGKKYLDLISGIGVSNVGHCAPEVVEAVREQAGKYMHTMVYGEFVLAPQVEFAEALAKELSNNLDSIYFVNSGSEAVEGALKLAKKFTGRQEIVAFGRSYHGSTHGALSVTGSDELKSGYGPFLPGVKFIEFNSVDDLRQINEKTACVIVELVRGEAGVEVPENEYLHALRKKCNKAGALLIADEIQTGFGRTGSMFAFQQSGIVPDIITMGKALGGGMPLGAFAAQKHIMTVLTHDPVLGHITTFGGHPVSCAAGLAALRKIRAEGLIGKIPAKEAIIRKTFSHEMIHELRGRGMMFAVEVGDFDKVLRVIHACVDRGVVTDWFLHCNTAIRIAPPLTVTEAELEWGLNILLEEIIRNS